MGDTQIDVAERLLNLQEELEKADSVMYAWARAEFGFAIVLAKRRRPTFETRPFVTWGFGPSGLVWGHYDLTERGGFESFISRLRDELEEEKL